MRWVVIVSLTFNDEPLVNWHLRACVKAYIGEDIYTLNETIA